MNKIDIGKKRFNEILGNKSEQIKSSLEDLSTDLAEYVFGFAYGEIYARKGLDDKSREIAAVSCIIGQNGESKILKTHIHGMLNVGWSKQDILELFLFLIPYKGFPTIISAIAAAKEVFNEDT